MYDCIKGADVVAILTEWNEFKSLDLSKAAQLVNNKVIVDCRNLIDAKQATKAGFVYQGIGQKSSTSNL
jgi:UDPglucose 6-dehydrogenase